MAEKKEQATWTDVKKALSALRREELINIIADLYKFRPEIKQFFHSRFALVPDSRAEYERQIYKHICPLRIEKQSVSKARKAISDYGKATGDKVGVAQLTACYVDCCMEAQEDLPVDAIFMDSATDTWIKLLDTIQSLPHKDYVEIWEFLDDMWHRLKEADKYLAEYMAKYMEKANPHQDKGDIDDSEVTENVPVKYRDMW